MTIKWWTFNSDNLNAALASWVADRASRQPGRKGDFELARLHIVEFLESPQARAHKLRGDPE